MAHDRAGRGDLFAQAIGGRGRGRGPDPLAVGIGRALGKADQFAPLRLAGIGGDGEIDHLPVGIAIPAADDMIGAVDARLPRIGLGCVGAAPSIDRGQRQHGGQRPGGGGGGGEPERRGDHQRQRAGGDAADRAGGGAAPRPDYLFIFVAKITIV